MKTPLWIWENFTEIIFWCNAAMDKYGDKPQKLMTIEEMSELTKALCKEDRYWQKVLTEMACDSTYDEKRLEYEQLAKNIEEEIVDVLIMVIQLTLRYNEKHFAEILQEKLNKLKKKLGSTKDVKVIL